jgi:hypothetical protein
MSSSSAFERSGGVLFLIGRLAHESKLKDGNPTIIVAVFDGLLLSPTTATARTVSLGRS